MTIIKSDRSQTDSEKSVWIMQFPMLFHVSIIIIFKLELGFDSTQRNTNHIAKKNPNQVIKRSSTDGRRVWRVEKYQFWVKEMWMRNEKQQSFMVDYVFARLPMSRRESMNSREEEEVAVKANRLVEFSPSHHRAPHGQSKASISMIRRYRDENKSLSKWINNLSEQERDVRSLYDETFTRYWKWQVSQVEKL